MNFRTLVLGVLAVGVTVSNSAYAQVTIPGSAQPGRVEDSLRAPIVMDGPEASAAPGIAAQVAAEGAENIIFTLKKVKLEGFSVYREDDVSYLYKDKVDTKVSLAEMYAIANSMTLFYRDNGYIMTQVIIPNQDITNGLVRFKAIEGFVDEVNFEFKDDVDQKTRKYLEAMAEKLTAFKPLTAENLERQLLLMNDLPGISAEAIIKPSESTAKAADLFIVISTKVADGFVSFDNYGSKFVGPEQFQGGVTLNSLFGNTNSLGVRIATALEFSELQFIEANYTQYFCTNGCRFELLASHTNSQPGFTLEPFEVESESLTVEATVAYPLMRARAQNLEAFGKFSYRDLETDSLSAALSEDRIRKFSGGLLWNKADQNLGVTTADIEVTQGLNILNATDGTNAINRSRANGDATFTKVEASLSRDQFIPNSAFSVFGAIEGQYTGNELLSSEQFGVGGSVFGRGFDSSEITGDTGVAAKVELRYNQYPQDSNWIESTQYYGFYDAGMVRNLAVQPGESTSRRTLTSAGVGVRVSTEDNWNFDFEVAKPLTRNVATEGNDDLRGFFRLSRTF